MSAPVTQTPPAPTPDTRPRDAATTRQALLNAARPLFAEHGYESTTVSQVARAAGFSPNLVTRYFGGKEGLFLEAMKTSLNVATTPSGTVDEFGHQFANQVVDRWNEQGVADPVLALLRAASTRTSAGETLGEFLDRESTASLTVVLMQFGLEEAEAVDRANAIQSFILGTVVTRRILRTGAIPAASDAELRAWMAASIQRLVGDVPAREVPEDHLPTSAGQHQALK